MRRKVMRIIIGNYQSCKSYNWIKCWHECSRLVIIPIKHIFRVLQVSSWGGYVFLINLIPLHVLALMITGRFSHRIYVAYCSVSKKNSFWMQNYLNVLAESEGVIWIAALYYTMSVQGFNDYKRENCDCLLL